MPQSSLGPWSESFAKGIRLAPARPPSILNSISGIARGSVPPFGACLSKGTP
eukprot:COSAG01_NODE_1026_length_12047_cov_169.108554_12_plen_52_part_00